MITHNAQRSVHIAIIGAGPSAFYVADALLKQNSLHPVIDIFDQLSAPFGLVRYGVAPDHQKIKNVTKIFERVLAKPNVRFFGNVRLGLDLQRSDLLNHYDQIVYAVGAQSNRQLNIPGESLSGSAPAREFVAWYNGHPNYADWAVDLHCESAVVVGAGNVALDVTRILAKSAHELKETDIADHALAQLAESKIKKIHVLIRRGPAQAQFTPVEVRELAHLEEADVVIDPQALELDPLSTHSVENDRRVQQNLSHFQSYASQEPQGKARQIHFRFFTSPVEILGKNGRVDGVRIEANELRPTESGYLNAHGTGNFQTIEAGLVLQSVGYRGVPLDGVPFDERRGIFPNEAGRLIHAETNEPIPNEYVVGWAKRGPNGVIGTNKPDAVETVQCMIADMDRNNSEPKRNAESILALLDERHIAYVTKDDWQMIDRYEIEQGKQQGRPRVKLTSASEMLALLAQ